MKITFDVSVSISEVIMNKDENKPLFIDGTLTLKHEKCFWNVVYFRLSYSSYKGPEVHVYEDKEMNPYDGHLPLEYDFKSELIKNIEEELLYYEGKAVRPSVLEWINKLEVKGDFETVEYKDFTIKKSSWEERERNKMGCWLAIDPDKYDQVEFNDFLLGHGMLHSISVHNKCTANGLVYVYLVDWHCE